MPNSIPSKRRSARWPSCASRCGSDNIALRQQLLTAQQDNKQLTTRLDAAKTRLQALLETLPEDV